MKVKGNLQVSGTLEGITFTDGTSTYQHRPKLGFDTGGFYLSASADGNPVVNLRSTSASGLTITDGISTFISQTRLGFSSNFYLSKDTQGGSVVNQRNPFTKAITLEFPSAAENIFMFRAHEAIRIVSGRGAVVGASNPSVTVIIASGTSRNSITTTHIAATAVNSQSTGTSLPISTAVIPAGSWVALETTATSGTVFELDVSLQLEYV